VPDRFFVIDAVPRTLSGKKLEVPVKRILTGGEPDEVVNKGAVKNPEALVPFIELARTRIRGTGQERRGS
jgi:acetoacetyl-CoA synthetase